MSSLVLDASVAVEIVLGSTPGRRATTRIADPTTTIHAPHLLHIEVAQVLRRLCSNRILEPARATAALEDLGHMDVFMYDHRPLLDRIWELRDNLTAYDAAYVALGEILDAPVLTMDKRMTLAPDTDARFELLNLS